MAIKITDLDLLNEFASSNDYLLIRDSSANKDKCITLENLLGSIQEQIDEINSTIADLSSGLETAEDDITDTSGGLADTSGDVESLLTEVNTVRILSPGEEDSPLTKNVISGVTDADSNVTVYRYGRVVSVDITIVLTDTVSDLSAWIEGFPLPVANTRTSLVLPSATTFSRPLRFILDTYGNLNIRHGAAGTYYHHFTYITTDAMPEEAVETYDVVDITNENNDVNNPNP